MGIEMNNLNGSVCLVILLALSFCHGADTTKIIYNDFSDISAWQLNGKCTRASNDDNKKVLRLTRDSLTQGGSAFIASPIKLVSDKGFLASFSAFFSFQITKSGGLDEGTGDGADGIAFVVQTVANNVGNVGSGIGYQGIPHSLGIEFDTWDNGSSANDPDDNHIGIDTNGNNKSIKTHSEKTKFNNGAVWFGWVDYDGDNQKLEVRYNSSNLRPQTPALTCTINLPKLLVQEDAYIGFTSATGLSYNVHDILSMSFINKFQPFTYSLRLSAKPDTVVNDSDNVNISATVLDMNNVSQPDSAKKTEWRIIESGGNPSGILKSSKGAEVLMVPEVAPSQVKVEAKVVVNGQVLIDTITIHVNKKTKPIPSVLKLSLSAKPDSVIKVHDSVYCIATITDQKNVSQPDSAKKTEWRIIESGGNPLNVLKSNKGPEVLLIPEVAYSQIKVEAKTLVNNQVLVDTISIHVTPGDAYKISIESRPLFNDTAFLRHFNAIDTVKLEKLADTATVFAVVRDKWGNYCRLADSLTTVWKAVKGMELVVVSGVDKKKYQGKIIRTGPEGDASVESSEGFLIKDTVLVKITGLFNAPHLIRAVYTPSTSTSKTSKLQLTFSEDVDLKMLGTVLPQNALAYFSSGGWTSDQVLNGSGFETVSIEQFGKTIIVQFAPGENKVIPGKDSIQLVAGTVNRQGNTPDGKTGLKVPVEMSNGVISIAVSSNPVKLSQDLSSVLPPNVIANYENIIKNNRNGVIVAISSSIPLKKDKNGFGSAIIYDAVGNIVAKDIIIDQANKLVITDYGFHWNCLNQNNRRVGRGTYLIIIRVVDIKDIPHNATVKLGVAE
jgi:hypothetical protein